MLTTLNYKLKFFKPIFSTRTVRSKWICIFVPFLPHFDLSFSPVMTLIELCNTSPTSRKRPPKKPSCSGGFRRRSLTQLRKIESLAAHSKTGVDTSTFWKGIFAGNFLGTMSVDSGSCHSGHEYDFRTNCTSLSSIINIIGKRKSQKEKQLWKSSWGICKRWLAC